MEALVLDDDPLIITLMKMILGRRGYKVESYGDPAGCPLYQEDVQGRGSLSRVPDLVIADYHMPNVNGLFFLEVLRKKGFPSRRMALMSGSPMPEQVVYRLDQFEVKFIPKPFRPGKILEWLDEVEGRLTPVFPGTPRPESSRCA